MVLSPIPSSDMAQLAGMDSVPTNAALTMTVTDTTAMPDDERAVMAALGAFQWRGKDQVAQAVLKLNLEDGEHDALKECASAHELYIQVLNLFTSQGLYGKIELRRRLCSLRKAAKEPMTSFINRASMLKIEMNRIGISTPEEELVAAMLAGLPAMNGATVELIESHGPEDLAGVTRRLLAAELKRRRLERDEEVAVALAASGALAASKVQTLDSSGGVAPAASCPPQMHLAYGHGTQQESMPQYYPMAPNPYDMMGGRLPMPHKDEHGGQPGRAPKLFWGYGLPRHVQSYFPNHAHTLGPSASRPAGRQHQSLPPALQAR